MTDDTTATVDDLAVVSTFSGSGGSSLGYERAGLDVEAAVDCAPEGFTDTIIDTYRANHPDTPLLERDVRDLDASDLLDVANRDVGEVGILDGSPPCSPFSSANEGGREGLDHDSATLFDHYQRLVDGLEPRYFVAENVPELAEGKVKGYFRDLCARLRASGPGYDLTVHKIDAAYFGAPHHRRRLIFVGTRTDQPTPVDPVYGDPVPLSQTLAGVEQTRDDIVIAREKMDISANAAAYRLLDPGTKLCHVYEHTEKGWTHRRTELDEPVPNPTAVLELMHPTERRYFSIPELRAIMGLPSDYQLGPSSASFNQRWECAIRALPPVLMQTFGTAIRQAHGHDVTQPTQPSTAASVSEPEQSSAD